MNSLKLKKTRHVTDITFDVHGTELNYTSTAIEQDFLSKRSTDANLRLKIRLRPSLLHTCTCGTKYHHLHFEYSICNNSTL